MSTQSQSVTDHSTAYRFIGSDTEVTHLGKRFTLFGEKAIFPRGEEEASEVDGPFITEADWQACNFTDEEAEKWANPADHAYYDETANKMVCNAPEDFLAKKKQALTKLHDLRTKRVTRTALEQTTVRPALVELPAIESATEIQHEDVT